MSSGASGSKSGIKTGILLAGCVCVLALPSAVLAFSASFKVDEQSAATLDSLDPEASAENLSRAVAMRSLAQARAFPFTPAGTANRSERSVTVAVRVDPEAAQSIIVRHSSKLAQATNEPGSLRMAPTGFNLGVSRGYQNFAQNLVQAPAGRNPAEAPDLEKFSLSPGAGVNHDDSRFTPRISIDEKRAAGRAPRTFAGDSGEVDLGGAYRVTENLDVTAGVRYSQDRERLLPLTDGKQDGQAVYVGTQFRF
ncbi:hypothetical protein GCM10011494_04620 [Novosphingobium endophyticum]|uniref:Porin domain-containing protein n=1 Tax=Novosphingobium endophyticum TaxID=1955250 RepID=A0A916X316_9SPHN|nr:hypothetical protein [Novosphingobium endophyticum]GGB89355.1 hypothetical protein GCM10011494_04620 [Novosphingobium endophyticum]